MSENTKTPRIRFKGFTDAWEQRKLCGIAEKVLEKNKNTSITETFTNSAEFGIISQRDYFDHDISNINNLSDYYVVQNDDFIYNPRISANAPVGPINRNKLGRKGVMSPLYTVFRASNIDFAFLEWYFKSEHWHGFMKFNGDSGARSDRFSIKDEIMFQMPLPYPNINEQERVGKFLSKIDNLITLHQRKCDKLKNIKAALLEKMFPQGEAATPKIRFKGFTDAWEQRKLGEIANIQKGQQLGKAEMSSTGTYYVLNGGMEASGFTNQYNTLANTISISEGGNSCGYVSLNLEHFWSGGHNYTLQNLKINTIFLYQWLKRQEKRIMALRVGSGLPNIQKSSLQDVYVKYSTTTEQQAIALFLIKIDNLITLHQRKVEKLKNIKSALLEKMFV